jgi:hypothetical protein
MSYDAYPNCADVVSEKFVKKQIPDAFSQFLDLLDEKETCFDEFASNGTYGDYDEEIMECWERVQKAFKENTGLTLGLDFHSPDEGNRGDEVESGVIFYVYGVWQYTEAGRKYKDHIQHLKWVTFG